MQQKSNAGLRRPNAPWTPPVKYGLAAFVLLMVFGAVLLWVRQVTGPRIVGRAVSPDGIEMCVVQKFNWGGEPFTTSFVVRRPGGPWAWFYFDHEDWYWGRAQPVFETNSTKVTFFRKNQPALSYDWVREIYWKGGGVWATGAQSYLPEGWMPGRRGSGWPN